MKRILLFLSLLCLTAALAPQASAADSVFQLNPDDPDDGYAEVDTGAWLNMTVRIMNENDDPHDFDLKVLNASDLNSEGLKTYWTHNGQEELGGKPTEIVVSVSGTDEMDEIRLTIEANPNALYGSWFVSLRAHDKDTTVDPDQQNRYLNLTIHVNEKSGVTVSVSDSSSTDLSVDVDSEASYTLQVQNTGNRQDTFNLDVGGGDWDYTLDTEQVTLDPGANVLVGLVIETDSDVDYGDSEAITIGATSVNRPTTGEMDSTVYIRVFEGVLLEPVTDEKSGEPGAMVTFDFTVTNKWSEEVTFTLEKKDWFMGTIENKPSNWDFTDASTDNTIEGFGTVTARARITIASDANANDVVTIIVKAYVGDGEPAETEIDVRVDGDYELQFEPLEISEFDVNMGTEIFLSAFLELTNTAKVSDEVLLEVEWTTGGDDWDLNLAGGSSWKYFAAGETKKVYVSVKAPPDSEGDFTTLRIAVSSGGDGLEKDNVELNFRVAAISGGGGSGTINVGEEKELPIPVEMLVGTVLLIGLGASSLFLLTQRSKKTGGEEGAPEGTYSDEWGGVGAGAAAAPPAAAPAAPAPPPAAAAGPVTVACPGCQTQLQIADPTRPLTVKCPTCATPLMLQATAGAAPPAAPAPAPPAAPPAAPAAAPPAAAPPAGPVTIGCPSCRTQMKIADTRRPLTVACPGCQTQLKLT
jgi:uncharacterized membrane protein